MKHERRNYERTKPPGDLAIRCTAAETGSFETYNMASSIVDISTRGLCILTVGRLRMGVPVVVELYVPEGGSRFKSRAVVAWSTTVESKGRTAHAAGLHLERPLENSSTRRLARVAPPAPPPKAKPAAPAPSTPLESAPEPRRAHRRFSPEEVEILCFPKGFLRALGLARNSGRRLKDLSRAGAQIVSARKLKAGQRVELQLKFKGEPAMVRAHGEVRWCKRDTSSLEPRFYAGILFAGLPEGSETSLRAIERAFIRS